MTLGFINEYRRIANHAVKRLSQRRAEKKYQAAALSGIWFVLNGLLRRD